MKQNLSTWNALCLARIIHAFNSIEQSTPCGLQAMETSYSSEF